VFPRFVFSLVTGGGALVGGVGLHGRVEGGGSPGGRVEGSG